MVVVVPVPDDELKLVDAETDPVGAAADAGAGSVRLPEAVQSKPTSVEDGGAQKVGSDVQSSGAAPAKLAPELSIDDNGVALNDLVVRNLTGRTMMESVVWYIQTYSLPLILGVVAGMCMANLDEQSYDDLRHFEVVPAETFALFGHAITIHFVINDIFMTFFFGIAAKEITEACLPGGSLNPPSKAANPLFATVGGAMGPVAMYFLSASLLYDADVFGAPSRDDFCAPAVAAAAAAGDAGDAHRRLAAAQPAEGGSCALGERWETALGDGGCASATELCVNGTETIAVSNYTWDMIANGWGIPTATDISLAWVVATVIFGVGHPAISFLLLLAVADDGLGLIIIAIFYPSPGHPFHGEWLLMVVLGMCAAFVLRINHVMRWWIYIGVAGSMCWVGLLGAALHPALAFVFVVPFLPALHGEVDGAHSGVSVAQEPADLAEDLVDEDDIMHKIYDNMLSKSASAKLKAEVRRVFNSLDLNSDGVLHVQEMETYIRSLSAETTEEESVEMLIANFHADMHTYMDFTNSIHNRQTEPPTSSARKNRIDDHDVVTFEEFYKWFEHTGGYHVQMVKRDLDHVPLFSEMNDVDKEVLARAVSFASTRGHNGHLRVYKPGEQIVTQGDEGHEMFIVHTGACVAIGEDGQAGQHYSGVTHPTTHEHTFGEVALLSSIKNKGAQGAQRAYTITATEDTTVWTLGDHELRIAGRQVFDQVVAMAQAYHDAKDDEVYHDHAPLHMFEHQTKFAVDIGMFFFAWANAGVKVAGAGGMTWVVLASLLLGKVFGIVLMVRQ
jgi:Na+/H+ antiporter NhaA